MKVLILFNDYLAAGGERQSVETEVRALRQAGVEVRLLEATNDRLADAGRVSRARAIGGDESARSDVARAISEFRPDVVHAENLFPLLGKVVPQLLGKQGLPWVRTLRNYRKGCLAGTFTFHGQPCRLCSGSKLKWEGVKRSCYRESKVESAGAATYSVMDRRAEASYPPNRYIAVSSAMIATLQQDLIPGVPIDVIHNAVDAFEARRDSVESDEFDVCFVGRLEAEKGINFVISLARRIPEKRFVVVGTGRGESEISMAVNELDNLLWLGTLPPSKAREVMSASTVAIVPSQWNEPFGRVAAEALSVGCLPLVSDQGGLPEVVAGLPYAATVSPPDDPDAWERQLRELLHRTDDPVDREKLASEATLRWQGNFSSPALASRLINAYSAALSDPVRRSS